MVALGLAALLGAPAVAAAEYPPFGTGMISDGSSRFAVLTPGAAGAAVYAAATGMQLGSTVALPSNPGGHPYRWQTIGLVRGRVFLVANDPDAPRTDALQDVFAVADPGTGTYRLLCSRRPPDPPCPFAMLRQIGTRWILAATRTAHGFKPAIFAYRESPSRFRFVTANPRQSKRFARSVSRAKGLIPDQALNLDGDHVTYERSWGYRRSLAAGTAGPNSTRAYVAKPRDHRSARIDIGAATRSSSFVRFGRRGLCATTGARVVLWDATTRRTWERPLPNIVATTTPTIACTATRVLVAPASAANASPFGPVWAWPDTANPAGWTRGPSLRPGQRRVYR